MERVVCLFVFAAFAAAAGRADPAADKARILAGALGFRGANDVAGEEAADEGEYYYYEDYPDKSEGGKGSPRMGDTAPGNREPFIQDLINLQRQHNQRNDKVGTEKDANPEGMDAPKGPSGASPLGAWAGIASYGFGDMRGIVNPNFSQFYGPLGVGDAGVGSGNLDQMEFCPKTAEDGIKYYCLKLEDGLYYDPWNPFCGYIECSSGVGTRICCSKGSWMGLMVPVTTTQSDLCRKRLTKKIIGGQCPKQTDFGDLCMEAERVDGIMTHSAQSHPSGKGFAQSETGRP